MFNVHNTLRTTVYTICINNISYWKCWGSAYTPLQIV